MKTLTKKGRLKLRLTQEFLKKAGIKLDTAKIKIRGQMLKDEYDNSIQVGNLRMFYTINVRFCGGKPKGYGKGFYIREVSINGVNDVKV